MLLPIFQEDRFRNAELHLEETTQLIPDAGMS
jgi:hypothetical protein